MMSQQVFIGPVININQEGELVMVKRAAVFVDGGKITTIKTDPVPEDIVCDNVTVLSASQFLMPGFIDCHIHAVQLPNLGVGYDKALLDWLETYTFPLEKKFRDEIFSEHVFDAVVKRTLKMGTTTACYFASLYTKSSIILAQKVAQLGQRAFVGKLNMNIERSDKYYENTEESIKNIKEFIAAVNDIGSPLVSPIITPRFALSCDMKLMKELGRLATEKDLHIQTHISENISEIEAVKNQYKNFSSYAAVYDAAGLLTNKTILAHGVHLTEDEISLLKQRNTAIIHCPSSNTCLKSGLCDVQRLKSKGIKVGLGTDVAGGQSPSILEAMKAALQVSCHLSLLRDGYKALNYEDVFYMATLGGATCLGIDDKVGNLVSGKQFDALIVDMNVNNGVLDELTNYTLDENLQRFIYSGDDRNIFAVYVNGHKVK